MHNVILDELHFCLHAKMDKNTLFKITFVDFWRENSKGRARNFSKIAPIFVSLTFESFCASSSILVFFSGPFSSSNGPKSLPAGQQVNNSNGPMSLHSSNNNKNWNPFEDMKNFADLTEDALVDQEFDQLRENERKQNQDPFQSAPFAVKQ